MVVFGCDLGLGMYGVFFSVGLGWFCVGWVSVLDLFFGRGFGGVVWFMVGWNVFCVIDLGCCVVCLWIVWFFWCEDRGDFCFVEFLYFLLYVIFFDYIFIRFI